MSNPIAQKTINAVQKKKTINEASAAFSDDVLYDCQHLRIILSFRRHKP